MNDPTTTDLRDFGYRELRMAGELLTAYKTTADRSERLGDGVHVVFNRTSGNVFLCDEDYNVAMMNGHVLEDWHDCGYCGAEGFAEDLFDGDEHRAGGKWEGMILCADDPHAEADGWAEGQRWDDTAGGMVPAEDEDEDEDA